MSLPPPKPLRRPDRVLVYKALYNYTAQQDKDKAFVSFKSSVTRPLYMPKIEIKQGGYLNIRTLESKHDEISFHEGDILYVTDASDAKGGWWKARCGSTEGLIPSNYVTENAESVDFPLHEAAKRGNISFLQECLANKVSINGLDKSGSTPLFWASHGGQFECLKVLLSCTNPKPDLNAQNKMGDSALHAAAWKGRTDIAQLLVHAGANPMLKNKENKTPLDLATDPETAAFLRRTSMNNENSLIDYQASDGEESD